MDEDGDVDGDGDEDEDVDVDVDEDGDEDEDVDVTNPFVKLFSRGGPFRDRRTVTVVVTLSP